MFNCLEGGGADSLLRERREICAKDAKGTAKGLTPLRTKKRAAGFSSFQNLRFSLASFAPLSRLSRKWLPVFLLALAAPSIHAQNKYDNIGRSATASEIKAWDIDVRPDFKGLPKGQGSVQQGEQVWEGKCASCHGSFGESNEVFPPMVGYTTAQDVKAGRVASLNLGADAPTRTTLMKLSQLSTLWDYINRAMPWTAPKSLTTDEVYAVTAYILNMANVLPDSFVLSNANMQQVQDLLPNRKGMTTAHALWPGQEFAGKKAALRPDVQGSACMHGCASQVSVKHSIPAYARNQSGNLAEQMRAWGPLLGVDTSKPENSEPKVPDASVKWSFDAPKNVAIAVPVQTGTKPGADAAPPPAPAASAVLKYAEVVSLLQRNTCTGCHAQGSRLVGPSFAEIAARHGQRPDAQAYLQGKIKTGGQGVWGAIPMPPMAIDEASARKIAQWLAQGAAK